MRSQNDVTRQLDLLDKQEIIEQELQEFDAHGPKVRGGLPLDIRAILAHVHEHLFSPDLNVDTARRACRLRNNNVSTRFRCRVGVGVRDYIEKRRMAAAKRLLRHGHLEIYLIAMAVGYEHQETFCRAFRRCVGCTPSEWRLSPSERRAHFPEEGVD